MPNARIRESSEVTKGMDERIGEGVLRWFGMGNDTCRGVYSIG